MAASDSTAGTTSRHVLLAGRLAVVLLVGLLTTRLAWMSDDALITLRTALNWAHGWGPGFNTNEAVQGYTHPLWFLVWTALGVTTGQWVFGILVLSIALTMGAVAVLVWLTPSASRLAVVGAVLVLSNAFMTYATSGLEGPLAYLAVIAVAAMTLRSTWATPQAVLAGLAVAAVILTRLDLLLLIGPAVLLIAHRWHHQRRALLAGSLAMALPIVIWLAFSWAMYQALLPNTFEAKTNLDIPIQSLILHGFGYLWVSAGQDPMSAIALAVAVVAPWFDRSWVLRVWSIGIVAYLAYVVYVGGDFMAGRFLAVPVLVSAFVLSQIPFPQAHAAASRRIAIVAVGFAALAYIGAVVTLGAAPDAFANPRTQKWDIDRNASFYGVRDERGYYVEQHQDLQSYLSSASASGQTPLGALHEASTNWPEYAGTRPYPSEVRAACGGDGVGGILSGPTTHWVSTCGLYDAFIAALPYVPEDDFLWRPGHFTRAVPEGYIEAVQTRDPSHLRDPELREQLTQIWRRITYDP